MAGRATLTTVAVNPAMAEPRTVATTTQRPCREPNVSAGEPFTYRTPSPSQLVPTSGLLDYSLTQEPGG
jgi:hypothetical protein